MPEAVVLKTYNDVANALPGLYVTESIFEAFFPALALIELGRAKLLGEVFTTKGKLITLEVTYRPSRGYNLGADEPQQRSIRIGREFFVTALKDYSDWKIKWWREAIQNSVDAGATEISIRVFKDPKSVTVRITDNGSGMDEDTLLNKFLVLGATTKVGAQGQAGGFGKAKELLLLPWISWKIHTRNLEAQGAGIDYTVAKSQFPIEGTELTVEMPLDQFTDEAAAIAFIQRCYLPNVEFTVNGKEYFANLFVKDEIKEVPDKAKVYFTPGPTQTELYVRARGLYMFNRWIGEVPGFVVAELTAPSIEILTANRDGFRDWHVGNAIDNLARAIAVDNMSALKAKKGILRKKFTGTGKFRATKLESELLQQIGPVAAGQAKLSDAEAATLVDILKSNKNYAETEGSTTLPSAETAQIMLDMKFKGSAHVENAIKQLVWEPDFYIINEIEDFFVPKKFFPETMTPHVLKLAKTWTELCRFVMMQLNSSVRFGVGFVFSENMLAAAVTEEHQDWIVVNPFQDPDKRTEIWHPTDENDLKWLYAAAIHECTHIADKIDYHNESFAAALTRNIAYCADGYRKLRAIVNSIKMHGSVVSNA